MVVAHGSGIDEIASVVITLVIIAAVWIASRRSTGSGDDDAEGTDANVETPEE